MSNNDTKSAWLELILAAALLALAMAASVTLFGTAWIFAAALSTACILLSVRVTLRKGISSPARSAGLILAIIAAVILACVLWSGPVD